MRKKKPTKKKKQALNSILYLSARCPSGGRRHASLSLPHAFIPISGCLWQGKLSAGVDFVFLQKKKNKQNKLKTSFCYGPSGLNATPRGKLRKHGNRWRPSGPTVPHVSVPNIESSHFFFELSLNALCWKESVSRGTWAALPTNESQLQGSADVRVHFLFAASLAR